MRIWTPDRDKTLKKLYPVLPTKEVAKRMSLSVTQINSRALRLGFKKLPGYARTRSPSLTKIPGRPVSPMQFVVYQSVGVPVVAPDNSIEAICPVCSSSFVTTHSRMRSVTARGARHMCSVACARSAGGRARRDKRKEKS